MGRCQSQPWMMNRQKWSTFHHWLLDCHPPLDPRRCKFNLNLWITRYEDNMLRVSIPRTANRTCPRVTNTFDSHTIIKCGLYSGKKFCQGPKRILRTMSNNLCADGSARTHGGDDTAGCASGDVAGSTSSTNSTYASGKMPSEPFISPLIQPASTPVWFCFTCINSPTCLRSCIFGGGGLSVCFPCQMSLSLPVPH